MGQIRQLYALLQKMVKAVVHIGEHPDDSESVKFQKAVQNIAIVLVVFHPV